MDFWERLDLPNIRKNAELTEQLIQSLCKSAEYYADKIFAFLAHSGFYDDSVPINDTITKQVQFTSAHCKVWCILYRGTM